jgi:hypothetical protein
MRQETSLREALKKRKKNLLIRDRRKQLPKNRKKKSFSPERMFKFQIQLRFLILRNPNYYLFAVRHALIEMLTVQRESARMTSL